MLQAAENFQPEKHPYALTPQDVSLTTFNAVLPAVQSSATVEENGKLTKLIRAVNDARSYFRPALPSDPAAAKPYQHALTLAIVARDTYVAELQNKYDVRVPSSRTKVDVTPVDGFGSQPFHFANMMRVTGKRLAAEAAQMGGWAVYPQGKSERNVSDFFTYVQTHHPLFQTPAEVLPDTMVRDALYYLDKRALDHVVVTDERRKILGLLSASDLALAMELDEEMEVGSLPIHIEVVTAPEDIPLNDAIALMKSERIHFLPIVTKAKEISQELRWVLTRKVAEQRTEISPHLDDEGRLVTALAVSAQRAGWESRIDDALAHGVSVLSLDSPRFDIGHMEWINRVRYAAEKIVASKRPVRLMVGNVDNPDIVSSIIAAAVIAGMPPEHVLVKVGIGPGHACITREVEGVGVPQFTVVQECAAAARQLGGNVVADGGIRQPGDLAKLIAVGASQGMIGTIAAPLVESAAVKKRDERGVYTVNFGMASEVFAQLRQDTARDLDAIRFRGTFTEGLGKQKVYRQPNIETVGDLTLHFRRGLQGAATMVGAWDMREFQRNAHFVLQNDSGYREGLGKTEVH